MKQLRFLIFSLFSFTMLFVFVEAGSADDSVDFIADFTINGEWASNLSNGVKTVALGDKIKLEYPAWYILTDNVEWYVKYDNGVDDGEWQHLDGDYYHTMQVYITGAHQVKVTVTRQCWSFWQGFYDETGAKTITLEHEVGNGETATKYPIAIVPGVLGYDEVDLLDRVLDTNLELTSIEYFFEIADAIRKDSNQLVWDVSVSPWHNTEDRGIDLSLKILDFLAKNDPCMEYGRMKVNILAHSHGATTSRVAVNKLANSGSSRVASLTTVAGPHFGTPSADGGFQFREMLNERDLRENGPPPEGEELEGNIFWNRVSKFFQSLGLFMSVLSNHPEYITPEGESVPRLPTIWQNREWKEFVGNPNTDTYDEEYYEEVILTTQEFALVAYGFKQGEMYKFNHDYPSVGLPSGGKYVFDDIDIEFLNNNDFPIDPNDLVNESELPPGENKYNRAYGYGAYEEPEEGELVVGDGLGNEVPADDPKAIQYYSFSGSGTYYTGARPFIGEIDVDFDPFDLGLLVFNSFHVPVGESLDTLPECYTDMTLSSLDEVNDILEAAFRNNLLTWSVFMDTLKAPWLLVQLNCLSACLLQDDIDVLDNNDPDKEGLGYTGATDSFIPVDSAHFGKYIKTYNWNHADEQNHTLGLLAEGIGSDSEDHPKNVYRMHANRLKTAGL